MLTAEGCASRRERLWKALPSACDALIVADPAHLTYFTGFYPSPFEFRTTEAAAMLIMEPGRAILVGDNVIGPSLEAASADEVVAPTWYEAKRSTTPRRIKLVESVLGRLATVAGRRIGVEMAAVPAGVVEGLRSSRPGVEIVDISPSIRPLRRAKDPDELVVLRRSIAAIEAGQAAAIAQVEPGMTERDAYLIVQRAAFESLGTQAIVYGDFASGPRCETDRGGPPTDRKIERGDLLLLDYSVVVSNYRGDFTNTFAVGSGPTDGQRRLFEACVGAMNAAEACLKPGVACRDVDAACRGHLASLGLEQHFGSHTGHGLGLGHPEPPYLVRESDETLVVGDVVAIEPGLYVPGVGGMRFERNYLITPDGFETLSNHDIRLDQGR